MSGRKGVAVLISRSQGVQWKDTAACSATSTGLSLDLTQMSALETRGRTAEGESCPQVPLSAPRVLYGLRPRHKIPSCHERKNSRRLAAGLKLFYTSSVTGYESTS